MDRLNPAKNQKRHWLLPVAHKKSLAALPFGAVQFFKNGTFQDGPRRAILQGNSMPHVTTPNSRCQFAIAYGDITPPVGMYHRMWGAATHDRSEGVHKPLRATVTVFRPLEGNPKEDQIVQVALDHCLLGKPEMDLVLKAINAATGVPQTQILIVFSHTHAAGLMSLDRQTLPGGDLIPKYLETMSAKVAELYKEAEKKVRPAAIVYGTGHCDLAAHRDFFDKTSNQFVWGFNPNQAADDTVQVARVTGDDGSVLATFVNYACHPTTLAWENRLISPDFIGAMREVVEKETSAPCVFIQGASGELGPKEGFVGDVAVADRNGRQLGYAALAAITALAPPGTRYEYSGPVVSGATLGIWKNVPVSPEDQEGLNVWKIRQVDRTAPLSGGVADAGTSADGTSPLAKG